jgi:hypothetical protein
MRKDRALALGALISLLASPPTAAFAQEDGDGESDGDESSGDEQDGVRFRGGFDIGGGFVTIPEGGVSGFTINLMARLGVQINHLFGIVYQPTPTAMFLFDGGLAAGAGVYNNLLAMFTFGHFLDVGVGPSVDVLGIAACSSSACGAGVLIAPGVDGRIAFNLGGLDGNGPRRSGFNIGFDVHPSFLLPGPVVLLNFIAGIGAEWY